MTLPKLSAAILCMAIFGSAYALPDETQRDMTLENWTLVSGAANGAAIELGAEPEAIEEHRKNTQSNLKQLAKEQGHSIEGMQELFNHGVREGQALVQNAQSFVSADIQGVLQGFNHDKSLSYDQLKTFIKNTAT